MQYPQRGENVTISLLEEERHPVAADEGHTIPALGDRHVALLGEDVLQVGLGRSVAGGGRGATRSGACVRFTGFIVCDPATCRCELVRDVLDTHTLTSEFGTEPAFKDKRSSKKFGKGEEGWPSGCEADFEDPFRCTRARLLPMGRTDVWRNHGQQTRHGWTTRAHRTNLRQIQRAVSLFEKLEVRQPRAAETSSPHLGVGELLQELGAEASLDGRLDLARRGHIVLREPFDRETRGNNNTQWYKAG